MLVILCCFTLWTQTSLWPLLVPLQHKAVVLWVRFLPQCLWFELAELAQLAAELYSPKESSHIRFVNLKDSFVVGHLSPAKMWNHCLRHGLLDFCSCVLLVFITVWHFLTITSQILSILFSFPILLAEILIVWQHEVFCKHFRSKSLAFLPMYNNLWTINMVYRSKMWSLFVEGQWQSVESVPAHARVICN